LFVKATRERWTELAESTVPRNYHSTALLLPDGSVWTAGSNRDSQTGHMFPNGLTWSAEPGLRFVDPERFDPRSRDTALTKEHRVEIFYPPYFARVDRPVIVDVTLEPIFRGRSGRKTITVTVRSDVLGGDDIASSDVLSLYARLVLMRCGSATHAFNSDQRCVELPVINVRSGNRLEALLPPNDEERKGVLPPGWYMLFVVSRRNVPSVGKMIQVIWTGE